MLLESDAGQMTRYGENSLHRRGMGHFVGASELPRLRSGFRLQARRFDYALGHAGRTAQDVLFRAEALAKNPIDCRIFFADNARRKTESGVGGKNP